MDKIRKATITGAVAGLASAVIFGETGTYQVAGVNLPTPVAIGLANGASSVVADLAHEYVLPQIPMNAKYANLEAMALGLGVSGGSTAFLLNGSLLDSSSMNAFLLGAGSYAAGDYLDQKFFNNGSTAFSATY
jgi:hypothetical protein